MKKWERREKKQKKRMPLHGRDTGRVYKDVVQKRRRRHDPTL